MENNVIINMKSIQSVFNEKTETELVTKGNFFMERDTFRISYEDSEATGFEGSVTEISVIGDKYASIIRKGTTNSDLVIEQGKKHHCRYETPFGSMNVGIYTNEIKNRLSEEGGSLYMKYTIDIDSSYMSDNEIILDVKKS